MTTAHKAASRRSYRAQRDLRHMKLALILALATVQVAAGVTVLVAVLHP